MNNFKNLMIFEIANFKLANFWSQILIFQIEKILKIC